MSRAPRAASSLDLLRRDLGGSFAAHARGLLASEFALLNSDGKEFGQLHLGGTPGAELGSGDYAASFEALGRRYRMVVDGEEVLSAGLKGRSLDELEISCGSRIYEARIGFLRNLAVTTYQEGGEAVRLSGGLTGRNYEALFATEDGCALPVAIFLLWHVAANRRRAYRTVSPTRGGCKGLLPPRKPCVVANDRIVSKCTEQKERECSNKTRTTAPLEKRNPA